MCMCNHCVATEQRLEREWRIRTKPLPPLEKCKWCGKDKPINEWCDCPTAEKVQRDFDEFQKQFNIWGAFTIQA